MLKLSILIFKDASKQLLKFKQRRYPFDKSHWQQYRTYTHSGINRTWNQVWYLRTDWFDSSPIWWVMRTEFTWKNNRPTTTVQGRRTVRIHSWNVQKNNRPFHEFPETRISRISCPRKWSSVSRWKLPPSADFQVEYGGIRQCGAAPHSTCDGISVAFVWLSCPHSFDLSRTSLSTKSLSIQSDQRSPRIRPSDIMPNEVRLRVSSLVSVHISQDNRKNRRTSARKTNPRPFAQLSAAPQTFVQRDCRGHGSYQSSIDFWFAASGRVNHAALVSKSSWLKCFTTYRNELSDRIQDVKLSYPDCSNLHSAAEFYELLRSAWFWQVSKSVGARRYLWRTLLD